MLDCFFQGAQHRRAHISQRGGCEWPRGHIPSPEFAVDSVVGAGADDVVIQAAFLDRYGVDRRTGIDEIDQTDSAHHAGLNIGCALNQHSVRDPWELRRQLVELTFLDVNGTVKQENPAHLPCRSHAHIGALGALGLGGPLHQRDYARTQELVKHLTQRSRPKAALQECQNHRLSTPIGTERLYPRLRQSVSHAVSDLTLKETPLSALTTEPVPPVLQLAEVLSVSELGSGARIAETRSCYRSQKARFPELAETGFAHSGGILECAINISGWGRGHPDGEESPGSIALSPSVVPSFLPVRPAP